MTDASSNGGVGNFGQRHIHPRRRHVRLRRHDGRHVQGNCFNCQRGRHRSGRIGSDNADGQRGDYRPGGLTKTGPGHPRSRRRQHVRRRHDDQRRHSQRATSDAALGLASQPVTVGAFGTLIYAGTTSTGHYVQPQQRPARCRIRPNTDVERRRHRRWIRDRPRHARRDRRRRSSPE